MAQETLAATLPEELEAMVRKERKVRAQVKVVGESLVIQLPMEVLAKALREETEREHHRKLQRKSRRTGESSMPGPTTRSLDN